MYIFTIILYSALPIKIKLEDQIMLCSWRSLLKWKSTDINFAFSWKRKRSEIILWIGCCNVKQLLSAWSFSDCRKAKIPKCKFWVNTLSKAMPCRVPNYRSKLPNTEIWFYFFVVSFTFWNIHFQQKNEYKDNIE